MFLHLLLPLEWDASFSKALPLLVKGKYITKKQSPQREKFLSVITYLSFKKTQLKKVAKTASVLKTKAIPKNSECRMTSGFRFLLGTLFLFPFFYKGFLKLEKKNKLKTKAANVG